MEHHITCHITSPHHITSHHITSHHINITQTCNITPHHITHHINITSHHITSHHTSHHHITYKRCEVMCHITCSSPAGRPGWPVWPGWGSTGWGAGFMAPSHLIVVGLVRTSSCLGIVCWRPITSLSVIVGGSHAMQGKHSFSRAPSNTGST